MKQFACAAAGRLLRISAVAMTIVFASTAMTGCNVAAWVGQAIPESVTAKTVDAQYIGLEGKTVAVLVSADERTLFRFPDAPRMVGRSISGQLQTSIPGVRAVNPEQVADFLERNPYWPTLPYDELIEKLHVDRLLIVDMIEYTTQEPGNAHIWQGTMTATVSVIEVEKAHEQALAFTTTIKAEYPEGKTVGMLESDDKTIQIGMHMLFGERVLNLFRQHKDLRKKG